MAVVAEWAWQDSEEGTLKEPLIGAIPAGAGPSDSAHDLERLLRSSKAGSVAKAPLYGALFGLPKHQILNFCKYLHRYCYDTISSP